MCPLLDKVLAICKMVGCRVGGRCVYCAFSVAALISVAGCSPAPPHEMGLAITGAGPVFYAVFPSGPQKSTSNLELSWGGTAMGGKLALADIVIYKGGDAAVTAPAGWKLIRDDGGQFVRQLLYWYAIKPGDPPAHVWSFGPAGAYVDAQGAVVLFDRAPLVNPVDSSSGTGSGSQDGSEPTAKSVKTRNHGELILVFDADDFGGAGFSAPENVGEILHEETDIGGFWILGAYKRHKGDTGNITCHGGQGFHSVAATVAIPPADITAQTD